MAAFAPETVAGLIMRRVAQDHEIQLDEVVFLQPGQIPKTTSGKVQRRACRALLQAGEFRIIARISRQAASTHDGLAA